MASISRHRTLLAFSLVEILVSVSLIGMLALTIGLAMQNAVRHSANARHDLDTTRVPRELQTIIRDELRWIDGILTWAPEYIVYTTSADPCNVHGLGWLSTHNTLYCLDDSSDLVVINDQVASFAVDPEIISDTSTDWLRGWQVTLQLQSQSHPQRFYVRTIHQPLLPAMADE